VSSWTETWASGDGRGGPAVAQPRAHKRRPQHHDPHDRDGDYDHRPHGNRLTLRRPAGRALAVHQRTYRPNPTTLAGSSRQHHRILTEGLYYRARAGSTLEATNRICHAPNAFAGLRYASRCAASVWPRHTAVNRGRGWRCHRAPSRPVRACRVRRMRSVRVQKSSMYPAMPERPPAGLLRDRCGSPVERPSVGGRPSLALDCAAMTATGRAALVGRAIGLAVECLPGRCRDGVTGAPLGS